MEEEALARQFYVLNKLPKDIAQDVISTCRNIMAKDPQETAACLQIIEYCGEMVRITSPFIPRGGIDLSPMTRGLLEIYYKTKLGQMEESVFARRLAVLDKVSSNIVENLISQCRAIMGQDPEEKAACLHVIESCEDMVRIASKLSSCPIIDMRLHRGRVAAHFAHQPVGIPSGRPQRNL
jgi:hypothetical protein